MWVLAAGTGKTTQITHDGGYAFPVFSPDGGRIACTRGGLVIIRRDDGSALRFPSPRQIAYAPAWSPDGKRLAILSDRSGAFSVLLLDTLDPYVQRLDERVRMDTLPMEASK